MNTQVRWGLLLAIFAGYALGQTTTINLATQGRNFDFSSAPYTRPASVGTALPATCTVGQMFFNISAPAGQNLYGCSSINAWTVVGNSNLPTASGSQSGILSASDCRCSRCPWLQYVPCRRPSRRHCATGPSRCVRLL